MKNSKIFLGMLVLVLAFGFVLTGCEQTVNGEISVKGNKAPSVSDVTVTKTDNNRYIIVTWKAPKAENLGYDVYLRAKDTDFAVSTDISYGNDSTYAQADGTPSVNTDLSKYSARINSLGNLVAGDYQFGVRASYGADVSTYRTDSDIKWAGDAITITESSVKPTSVTLTSATNQTGGIITINLVLPPSVANGQQYEYSYELYRDGNSVDSGSGSVPTTGTVTLTSYTAWTAGKYKVKATAWKGTNATPGSTTVYAITESVPEVWSTELAITHN
ncbi:hypothetical protein FACS1894109_04890 [Spirochaetia bacterium]|nr:hypothetical protein FACS1894109_04890 [Spirochaetia bacterium]